MNNTVSTGADPENFSREGPMHKYEIFSFPVISAILSFANSPPLDPRMVYVVMQKVVGISHNIERFKERLFSIYKPDFAKSPGYSNTNRFCYYK